MSSPREKSLFLTLTAPLTRPRDAHVLYSKFGRLWNERAWIFDPEKVGERGLEDLHELFEGKGVRFGREDAKGWFEICRSLCRKYNRTR